MPKNFLYSGQTRPKLNREIIAGLSTFFSMVYITLITPDMLSPLGMDAGAVFVATCLVCFLGCFFMGLIGKLPIGVAPGIAILAYFSNILVQHYHLSWQAAITATVLAGIGLVLIAMLRFQDKIIRALPDDFFPAICAGLGFFLCFIGIKKAQFIYLVHGQVLPEWTWQQQGWVFLLGLLVVMILDRFKIYGAFLIAIFAATILAFFLGIATYHGIIATPPSISPTLLKMKWSALQNYNVWIAAFCLLMITLFDSAGTIVGLTLMLPKKQQDHIKSSCSKGVFANSLSSLASGLLGVTTTSTFLESATGIRAGGKSGITAIVIGCCFLLMLLFSPLAKSIPASAIAPILFYVGLLMLRGLGKIQWRDPIIAISCALTVIVIPITLSIADGIGVGLITHTLLSSCSAKRRDKISWTTFILTGVFIVYFVIISNS